jgi:hypothetical protein
MRVAHLLADEGRLNAHLHSVPPCCSAWAVAQQLAQARMVADALQLPLRVLWDVLRQVQAGGQPHNALLALSPLVLPHRLGAPLQHLQGNIRCQMICALHSHAPCSPSTVR